MARDRSLQQHRATGLLLKKSEQHHSGKRRMLVPAGVSGLADCGVKQNMGTYRVAWGEEITQAGSHLAYRKAAIFNSPHTRNSDCASCSPPTSLPFPRHWRWDLSKTGGNYPLALHGWAVTGFSGMALERRT